MTSETTRTVPYPMYSLCFPVYGDEKTVISVINKGISFFESLNSTFEIIVVNDCSPDQSGKLAENFSATDKRVRVFHHECNKGYGAALKTAFTHARGQWICQLDGDDEYDVFDFAKLIRLQSRYDIIITFRYVRLYSGWRQFVSRTYNAILRMLFQTSFRDVSTGLRMFRSELLEDIEITSNSPFVGAELAIKAMLKGYAIGEVGIQTFPREFGKGQSVTLRNILATIKDMKRIHSIIFSENYDLPEGRPRNDMAKSRSAQLASSRAISDQDEKDRQRNLGRRI